MGPSRVGAPGVRAAAAGSSAPVARVALICPDLLFGSKLRGALGAAGHEVVAPGDPADVQVIDLTADADERLGEARIGELPTLAFYSHVERSPRQGRGRRGGPRGAALAHGARDRAAGGGAAAARAWRRPGRGPAGGSRIPKRTSKRAQASRARRSSLSGGLKAGASASSWARTTCSSSPEALRHLVHGLGRVRERLARAVAQRRQRVAHELTASRSSVAARGGHHQLGVARRAVAVHAELACVHAAEAQRHALGVPERHHRVHPPGDQARHGREADRDPPDVAERRRRAPERRAARRRRRAGRSRRRACPPARRGRLRSPRAITAASGRWTSAPTPTRSCPALAGEAEIVDVHHGEVRPAGGEQLDRVRGRRRQAAPRGPRRGAGRRRRGRRCRSRRAPRWAGSRAPAGRYGRRPARSRNRSRPPARPQGRSAVRRRVGKRGEGYVPESAGRGECLRPDQRTPQGGRKCRNADPPHISPSSSAR